MGCCPLWKTPARVVVSQATESSPSWFKGGCQNFFQKRQRGLTDPRLLWRWFRYMAATLADQRASRRGGSRGLSNRRSLSAVFLFTKTVSHRCLPPLHIAAPVPVLQAGQPSATEIQLGVAKTKLPRNSSICCVPQAGRKRCDTIYRSELPAAGFPARRSTATKLFLELNTGSVWDLQIERKLKIKTWSFPGSRRRGCGADGRRSMSRGRRRKGFFSHTPIDRRERATEMDVLKVEGKVRLGRAPIFIRIKSLHLKVLLHLLAR